MNLLLSETRRSKSLIVSFIVIRSLHHCGGHTASLSSCPSCFHISQVKQALKKDIGTFLRILIKVVSFFATNETLICIYFEVNVSLSLIGVKDPWPMKKTLPKAQWTRGLSSAYQSHLFKSYHKKNLNQDYLQNLDQALTSKFQPIISIST